MDQTEELDDLVPEAKSLSVYTNTLDPATGKPYRIPMLSISDPDYATKYAQFAKEAETNPTVAKSVLHWS
jgi:hypothetical protein